MPSFAIHPNENKEYFSGIRTILSSIGFGLLGAYVYGAITNLDKIDKSIFGFMVVSLVGILALYLMTLKGNTWYGKSPVNRQMRYWRKFCGWFLIFSSQVVVGVFCSLFNDFLLSGENGISLIVLYILLVFICIGHTKLMVVLAVEPKKSWFKKHPGKQ